EPHDVLDAVVQGAAEMIGDEVVGLRLINPHEPQSTVLVSSVGISPRQLAHIKRGRIGEGAGGRAIREDGLVIIDNYSESADAIPLFAGDDLQVAMAAPVREKGRVVGSLVVATRRLERRYGPDAQEMLMAFAEHASLALTDAKMVTEALHHAYHDGLTDLPNRALFVERLESALDRSRRGAPGPAVLFLDLDRFKIVNDSLGHAAGDELLIEVASRVSSSLRPGDTAARFGGDEFAILLEQVSGREAAETVAMRILKTLRAPLSIAGRDVFVNASIGIAVGGRAADDAIRDADMAMYRAKAQGKARYAVFEPAMRTAVIERAELEADLQRVLERDELELHYQPIVRLSDAEVIGVEALVRWRHPTRGLVPPSAFIPLAEESQLMSELGRWILREACRQVARWQGWRPLELAVNLSPRQLQSPGIADDVAAALEESQLPPSTLVLEITETAIMEDVPGAIACLRALKNLGSRLAIDDFGTGYSSLHYLRRFPIDILKIDKAFVDDLANGDSTLAKAIIDLGESFKLQIVAEGIESEQQRNLLLALGCRYGQGYHFRAPGAADEIEPMLIAPPVVLGRRSGA
ncbi:MAG: putative bifunctional diguanylate cyclase/phosphodiesterase, partial [Solirubrobacteraceae bacterium]